MLLRNSSTDCEPAVTDLPFERFRRYLCRLARAKLGSGRCAKLDASDVVQETLLQAFEKRDQFRGASDGEAIAWLRRILENHLVDVCRTLGRQKRDLRRECSLYDELDGAGARLECCIASVQTSPDARAEEKELLVRLDRALDQLSLAQWAAIDLHHLQGLSIAETAGQLGRTPAAVGGLLRRGMRKLRVHLMVPGAHRDGGRLQFDSVAASRSAEGLRNPRHAIGRGSENADAARW